MSAVITGCKWGAHMAPYLKAAMFTFQKNNNTISNNFKAKALKHFQVDTKNITTHDDAKSELHFVRCSMCTLLNHLFLIVRGSATDLFRAISEWLLVFTCVTSILDLHLNHTTTCMICPSNNAGYCKTQLYFVNEEVCLMNGSLMVKSGP